jgi:hypothetical protein
VRSQSGRELGNHQRQARARQHAHRQAPPDMLAFLIGRGRARG